MLKIIELSKNEMLTFNHLVNYNNESFLTGTTASKSEQLKARAGKKFRGNKEKVFIVGERRAVCLFIYLLHENQ